MDIISKNTSSPDGFFMLFQKTDEKEISDKTVLRRCFRTNSPKKTKPLQNNIAKSVVYILVYTT